MDRRDFVEGCALGAGVVATTLATGSWAAQATPRRYAKALCQRRSKFPHFGRSKFPHLLWCGWISPGGGLVAPWVVCRVGV